MIYVTGDLHGDIDISKLNTKNFPEQKLMTKNDYVIICGDFGLIWNNSNEEKYWLKWLQQKNFTTLWIDGNHENFNLLNEYPIEEWNGGKIHKINDSVIHLMRGQVFNIDGNKIFTFGGAESIDKLNRKENISWWAQELPTSSEYEEGLMNLEKNNWEVDYIFTHTCSSETLKIVDRLFGFQSKPEIALNKYLNNIQDWVKFTHWYFGHYHENIEEVNQNQSVLYDRIVRIR